MCHFHHSVQQKLFQLKHKIPSTSCCCDKCVLLVGFTFHSSHKVPTQSSDTRSLSKWFSCLRQAGQFLINICEEKKQKSGGEYWRIFDLIEFDQFVKTPACIYQVYSRKHCYLVFVFWYFMSFWLSTKKLWPRYLFSPPKKTGKFLHICLGKLPSILRRLVTQHLIWIWIPSQHS